MVADSANRRVIAAQIAGGNHKDSAILVPTNQFTIRGQHRTAGAKVAICCRETLLVKRSEIADHAQVGCQFEVAVTGIASSTVQIKGPIAGSGVNIAPRICRERAPAAPDAAFNSTDCIIIGRDPLETATIVAIADDPSTVRLIVAKRGETEIHASIGEQQRGSLALFLRIEVASGHTDYHRATGLILPGAQVQSVQKIGWVSIGNQIGCEEKGLGGRINDRCGGNANIRRRVGAAHIICGHGSVVVILVVVCPDGRGIPVHRVRVKGIHTVVLCGDDHKIDCLTTEIDPWYIQWLRINLSIYRVRHQRAKLIAIDRPGVQDNFIGIRARVLVVIFERVDRNISTHRRVRRRRGASASPA